MKEQHISVIGGEVAGTERAVNDLIFDMAKERWCVSSFQSSSFGHYHDKIIITVLFERESMGKVIS